MVMFDEKISKPCLMQMNCVLEKPVAECSTLELYTYRRQRLTLLHLFTDVLSKEICLHSSEHLQGARCQRLYTLPQRKAAHNIQ